MTLITFTLCSAAFTQGESYTVKKGDTLYSISKRFNISIESLSENNDINDPSVLYPGMKLKIPGGYTVKKGDTYYGVALKHGMTLEQLFELNNLSSDVLLFPGQVLSVNASVQDETEIVVEEVQEKAEDRTVEQTTVEASLKYIVEDDTFWPVNGSRVSMTGKLSGIRINCAPGEQMRSVAGGTVVWASEYGIYKYLVLIETGNGYVYGYGGNQRATVRVGESVKAGTVIGILGENEKEEAAYFFVYKDGKPVDPAKAPRV